MASHDLLSEDDFFSDVKKDKEHEEEDVLKPELPEDDLFAGGPSTKKETAMVENKTEPEAPQDFSEDVQDQLEIDRIEPQEKPLSGQAEKEKPKAEDEELTDYYDDKQGGINYKPVLKWVGMAFLLIVIIVAVKIWLFSGGEKTPPVTEKKAKVETSGKTKALSAEESRKAAYYSRLSAHTQASLSSLTGLAKALGKKNKVSSMLMYGDERLVEVYSKNRTELAKLNMDFRERFKNLKPELISSSQRPGKNGGILGLFRIHKSATETTGENAPVNAPFKSAEEALNWLNFLAQNNSLTVKNSTTQNAGSKDEFTLYQLEANIQGSVQNCLQLINDMAASGKNIQVRKLNLTARDQKSFSSKKYQLKLILRIFV